MLAADAELECGTTTAPALSREPHKLPYPFDVERDEGIDRKDAAGGVLAQETGAVVAADAEGRLSQIVGAEGEELGTFGDIAGAKRGARQFDHGADEIF